MKQKNLHPLAEDNKRREPLGMMSQLQIVGAMIKKAPFCIAIHLISGGGGTESRAARDDRNSL